MTTSASIEAAAQFLVGARNRRTPGSRIPMDVRPTDVDGAVAVQRRITELIGQPVGAWKCSVPSPARPVIAAPIFGPAVRSQSPYPVVNATDMAKVEPEIAFVLARDLPARATAYTESEVRDAVREARFVLEVLGTRYEDPTTITYAELMADHVGNQGLFVGPVLHDYYAKALETFPVTVSDSRGVIVQRDGKHGDVHPLRPLYWLANYLATRGDYLRAGQIVTTGSYCGVVEVPLDEPLTFTYGDLGALAVTFTRAE